MIATVMLCLMVGCIDRQDRTDSRLHLYILAYVQVPFPPTSVTLKKKEKTIEQKKVREVWAYGAQDHKRVEEKNKRKRIIDKVDIQQN